MRTVYVNGHYVPENEARVSVFDRGFLFADAAYEVTSVVEGKLIDFAGHCQRLHRSLRELDMGFAMPDEALLEIHRQLIRLNSLDEGLIYLQVTRGEADRDFLFPPAATPNSVVLFSQRKALLESPQARRGIKVITLEDLRWQRCDIKTVQLLYPSMAKMQAQAEGVDDAGLVRNELVTEGTSNNAYIVTPDGSIVTRELSHSILHGITRRAVLDCAERLKMNVEERPFTVAEALEAQEAFSTSASSFVMPVVEIDRHTLGDGRPGEVATSLRETYIEESLKTAI